jgi:hypothetical protein
MNAVADTPLGRAKDRLTVLELGEILYPGWKGGKSCHSPFRDDRNPSFSIFGDGRKWKDFGSGESGDVVDFIAKAKGIDKSAGAKELIALAGSGGAATTIRHPIDTRPAAKEPLKPMPPALATIWDEGVEYLLSNLQTREGIEKWRHWPAGTVNQLAENGLIGCPLLHGRRGVAFPVQYPHRNELGVISTFNAGFHFRHKPTSDEARVAWTYLPNAKEHGVSCPALPFVIGAGFVTNAQTVIVTEGQWDAITLAAAAGWLASDASWPERLTVFATRGAGAWRPLIGEWTSYWPINAKFVLFADGDEAGATWKSLGGFKDTLCVRGHSVRLIRPRLGNPKDLNDIHIRQPISPETIAGWISMETCTK